jgi:integrase
MREAIERRTEAELGKRIPPHLFRDCLATMIAFERPDRIDDVSALLGHRRPGSKDGYIAVAKSLVAQHRVRDLEAEARHKSGKKKPTFRCEARR